MNIPTRISLNGMLVYPFSSVSQLIHFADDRKGLLVAVNAEKVMRATDETRRIVNENIGYADGAGVKVALRRKGERDTIRIAGCDLWLDIVKAFHDRKTFYLVGGRQEVIDETVARLKKEYPDIRILGHRNGYLHTPAERQALIDDVAQKQPDVVFVAMGSPVQEILMADMMARHRAVYQGLGGSFDVYTGRVKRAPKWWQDHNLEFLYRFLRQPQRYRREVYRLKFLFWMLLKKL